MVNCPFCKGNIERKTVEHIHRWGDELYLFEDVKAEVCRMRRGFSVSRNFKNH